MHLDEIDFINQVFGKLLAGQDVRVLMQSERARQVHTKFARMRKTLERHMRNAEQQETHHAAE